VKTALSAKGISAPVNKMDLVITGVFGIIYLCLGWAESSTHQFWRPFFRIDLSPTIIRGVRVACRGAVKFGHILIASLHFCLYFVLSSWPMYLGYFILISRVPPSLGSSRQFLLLGYSVVSLVIMIVQMIAFISIMDRLRRFPRSKRFINHIERYVESSLDPVHDDSVGTFIGQLLIGLILFGPIVWLGIQSIIQS